MPLLYIGLPITAAGTGASPESMAFAAGAGSVGFPTLTTKISDCKGYFNRSMGKTFKTWTVLTSIISIIGLIAVFILDMFI